MVLAMMMVLLLTTRVRHLLTMTTTWVLSEVANRQLVVVLVVTWTFFPFGSFGSFCSRLSRVIIIICVTVNVLSEGQQTPTYRALFNGFCSG